MKKLSVIKKFSLAILFALTACVSTGLFGMQLQLKYPIQNIPLDAQAIQQIESIIGYQFKNKKLLVKALTSRTKDVDHNYEQYEYVGDAILGKVIAQMLLHQYPNATPGDMTNARSALVSREPMAALCMKLGLHNYVQYATNEIPISCLCDIIESIITALEDDGGPEAAKAFILKFFLPMTNPQQLPKMMHHIIKKAAKDANKNILYVYSDTSCSIQESIGTGQVSSTRDINKNNPLRLAKYLAQRKYIKEQLGNEYQGYLVRLATDPDYKPNYEALNIGNKPIFKAAPMLNGGVKTAAPVPNKEVRRQGLMLNRKAVIAATIAIGAVITAATTGYLYYPIDCNAVVQAYCAGSQVAAASLEACKEYLPTAIGCWFR